MLAQPATNRSSTRKVLLHIRNQENMLMIHSHRWVLGVRCWMEAWRCHLHAPKRVGHICSEKTHTTKKNLLCHRCRLTISASKTSFMDWWQRNHVTQELARAKKGKYLSIRPPVDPAFRTSPPLYHKSPSFSCVEKRKREQSWVCFSPVWTRKMSFVGWEK